MVKAAGQLGAREVDPAEYQAIVGSLMYVALAMRPDISFAVSALSRYNSCPRTTHLTAAKRVLRYLKTTSNYRLHLCAKHDSNGDSVGDSDGDAIANETIGFTDTRWLRQLQRDVDGELDEKRDGNLEMDKRIYTPM